MMENLLYQASVWVIPVVLAITIHEAAHGWVANRLGDDTAARLGRVTFNPARHIDPFGTIIMPGMLLLLSGGAMMLGYAKPVPVNFQRLRNPKRDMVWVAAAGPGVNLLMAVAASLLLSLAWLLPSGDFQIWTVENLRNALLFNVLLAVFNMIPIPPLDGGRVAVGLLPAALARPLARLEPAGLFLILGMVFLLPLAGAQFGFDLNIFGWLVIAPTQVIAGSIASVFQF